MNAWHNPKSYLPETEAPIAWNDLRSFDATADESECVEDMFGRCLTARAGQASPRAVLRRLGHTVPIAIAVITALYFGGQFARGLF